ncbi:hypothetical protein [Methylocapsa palsarum]|uniref:Uncharacterized protein n=1 Tax=Methylocapsa palsarum TaxID=1612308 RepID=A0A1I3WU24_9HYPH|nr:hypothetical protein [Methylocapsa palsarum]SFK11114.1 hypothetical protein SAMN05444581_102154 [Methylocapsa palsarum]
MGGIDLLEAEFRQRPLRRHLEIAEAGLVLGAGTVIAPLRREGRGASLDVSGEDRVLALLRAGFSAPVDARILPKLRRAVNFSQRAKRRWRISIWRSSACRPLAKIRRSGWPSPTS